MNIFYFYDCPIKSAQAQPDKMLVKMPLETAQMLCTAHRELDGDKYADETGLYKRAYWNHPCTIWARESSENYKWLYQHFLALGSEYKFRYGKVHSTDSLLRDLLSSPPTNIKWGGLTTIPQAMPDHCKKPDSVDAYRTYYIQEKKRFAKWTKRQVPHWFWAA